MSRDSDRAKVFKNIEIIVDEAKSKAESIGETLSETIQTVLTSRDNVVMVRVNKETLSRLDELVEASLVNSRSEAAAFLIAEGIRMRWKLFEQISDKIKDIRKAKEDLKRLLNEEDGHPSPTGNEGESSGKA